MTYAFQTPEKLCFILDLMNGGDLHYHLSQHGVFSEGEVRFYAAEVILGLEHMHSRYVVYRDLKVITQIINESGFESHFLMGFIQVREKVFTCRVGQKRKSPLS